MDRNNGLNGASIALDNERQEAFYFFSCKCYKCHNLHVEPFKIILKIFSIHYSILKLFIESLQRSLYVTLPCPQSVEQLSFKIEVYQKYREKKDKSLTEQGKKKHRELLCNRFILNSRYFFILESFLHVL